MARPLKNNVEYFPFLCKEGKAMYYIETNYGNDGYATWVKILRELAVANNHYLNLSDKVNLMFLASKCRVSQDVLLKIIGDLADLGEIDADLWNEAKVIWNQKFIESIQDAYSKRSNECMTIEDLRELLLSLRVLKPNYCPPKVDDNTQSIVDKTKVKKTKVKKIMDFIPPLLSEVELFFEEKGFSKELAARAFNNYALAEPPWTDRNGNHVKSWKQKMNTVWMTEENKKKESAGFGVKNETGRFSINQQTVENVVKMKQAQQEEQNQQRSK